MIKADRLYSICWPLLRKLMEHRNNRGIFNEPVDAVALNIPEYNKIIKKPMDLGTVRINLEEGKFESLKRFLCGSAPRFQEREGLQSGAPSSPRSCEYAIRFYRRGNSQA